MCSLYGFWLQLVVLVGSARVLMRVVWPKPRSSLGVAGSRVHRVVSLALGGPMAVHQELWRRWWCPQGASLGSLTIVSVCALGQTMLFRSRAVSGSRTLVHAYGATEVSIKMAIPGIRGPWEYR